MDPIAFHIGSKPVYWYGVLVAAGFLAGIVQWTRLGKREHRPEGFGSDVGIWLMIGGVLGARLAYVLANWPQYAAAPWTILRIDQGGLVFYGGLFGGAAAVILMARVRREPLWSLADFVVTALPLGHAFGRVGCFLNRCCVGSHTTCALGVNMDGEVRHPTQLYEAGLNVLVFVLLVWLHPRRRRDGDVLAVYLLCYSVIRFSLEFVRGDERLRWAGLDVAQWTSLAILSAGAALWFHNRWIERRSRP